MADDETGGTQGERVRSLYARAVTFSWGFVGVAGAGAIGVFLLWFFSPLVVPLVLSVFLAVVFGPVVDWLHARRVPRSAGALLVLLLIAAIFIGAIAAVVIGIVDQADVLSERFDDVVERIDEWLEQSDLAGYFDSLFTGAEGSGGFLSGGLASTVGSVFSSAGAYFSGFLLGVVLTYYLLKDGRSLVGAMLAQRRPETADRVGRVLAESARDIRMYMRGRTILAVVQGVVIGIVAVIAGVPLAFAIAIVNIVGGYIPYVGGFVGGAFAFLMALSEGGLTLGLVMLAAVVAISVGLENMLEPALLGNQLEMHPIVVLLATFAGGMLIGLAGLVLAAPTVAVARTVFRALVEVPPEPALEDRAEPASGPGAGGTVDPDRA